jgi:hypothetical protein
MKDKTIRFYDNRWRTDKRLQSVTASARGMLATMQMQASDDGTSEVRFTNDNIQWLFYAPATEAWEAIHELTSVGLIKLDAIGRLFTVRFRRRFFTATPYRYVSREDRAAILAAGQCAMCGSTNKLTVDHRIPLSRGGRNIRQNFQCLCQSCNSRKGDD